jgi:hypothetical protein
MSTGRHESGDVGEGYGSSTLRQVSEFRSLILVFEREDVGEGYESQNFGLWYSSWHYIGLGTDLQKTSITDLQKTTALRIPVWSPTMVLTERHSD